MNTKLLHFLIFEFERTTSPISSTASSTVKPRARHAPKRLLRLNVEKHVNIKSPIPDNPFNVSALPPKAIDKIDYYDVCKKSIIIQ